MDRHHHILLSILQLSTVSLSAHEFPTPSNTSGYLTDSEKTENPTLSLALKICFGLFGAIFIAAVLFFAWRAFRRPRGGKRAVERDSVPPQYGEERGTTGVRMPERTYNPGAGPDERVASWIRDVEAPPPPSYERATSGG
ncbi:Protein of unknown function [Pyronema omphalodes CBS 100304]|uniref:Transmembrane protein n=1 Tax=Pyronema omphalodes (strain CBS 100304) TaxID=1076935 RepID=U4LQB7_PYROM|nr:Protein of unknown function [Pyronema omphalodes CBS 100304]